MGAFEPKIKLIIVHSKKTAMFANYLQMLIGSKDDEEDKIVGTKDDTVDTVIWTFKEYLAQKPMLSGSDHILFMGDSKQLSEEVYGMKKRFERYGMAYGWLGKRAYLCVSKEDLNKEQLTEFADYSKEYLPDTEAPLEVKPKMIVDSFNEKEIKDKIIMSVKSVPVLIPLMINGVKKDTIRNYQYRTLTTLFYIHFLNQYKLYRGTSRRV